MESRLVRLINTPLKQLVKSMPETRPKREHLGLFGRRTKMFGNQVSHSQRKTRRSWDVNSQRKRVWSQVLEKSLTLKLSPAELRTMDKKGGFDLYLLNSSETQLSTLLAIKLKRELLAKLEDNRQARRKARDEAKRAAAAIIEEKCSEPIDLPAHAININDDEEPVDHVYNRDESPATSSQV